MSEAGVGEIALDAVCPEPKVATMFICVVF